MTFYWLSYRRRWYLLWLFDLLTMCGWAFFLYKNPSPFGKEGDASADALLYIMGYGLFRALWLLILTVISFVKKRWWTAVLAAVHGAAWLLLYFLLSVLFMGSVGGH